MVVSYKLETDPDLLIAKAKMALERYHHDLVIGNLLETRKREVVFVTSGRKEEWIRLPESTDKKGDEVEIESLIVPALIKLHDGYILKLSKES
jgi:phosphopantothenate-cysteine ligase